MSAVSDQSLDDLDAERGAQIGRHRFLVAVDDFVIEADAVLVVAPVARFIARVRPLDLDDLGAEIGQEHRADRRRQERRDVDDPDALEGHRCPRVLADA